MLLKPSSLNRFDYIDNICGLLIIYMIFFYHLVIFCNFEETPSIFRFIDQIFFFFMSWFFFKSGMFYKERSLIQIFYGSIKRLLIPYLIFNAIGGFCDIFLVYYHNNGNISLADLLIMPFSVTYYNEATYANFALWFLFSLFVVKLMFSALLKLKIKPWIICLVFFVLGFLMNYYRNQLDDISLVINIFGRCIHLLIPYYLGNVCYGLVFYCLGYILREKQFNKYLFVFSFGTYIIHFFIPCIIDVRANESSNYFIAAFYSIAGIITFNNVFRVKVNKKICLLSHIGKNSMVYYVTHFVFMSFCFGVINDTLKVNKWYLYLFFSVLTIIFLFMCDYLFRNKKINWMIGN